MVTMGDNDDVGNAMRRSSASPYRSPSFMRRLCLQSLSDIDRLRDEILPIPLSIGVVTRGARIWLYQKSGRVTFSRC